MGWKGYGPSLVVLQGEVTGQTPGMGEMALGTEQGAAGLPLAFFLALGCVAELLQPQRPG